MPRYDRTGPEGMGPMTGRGMGQCAGYTPGYAPRGRGRGFYRLGMAFRRGWGRWDHPVWDRQPDILPQDEKEWLQNEESYLKQELSAIQERMKALGETSE